MAKKIKNLAVKQTEAPVRVDTLFNSSRKVDPALASLFAGSTLIQPIIEATSKATSEPTLTRVSKAQKDDSSASEGDESNSENESDSNHSGSEGENDESGSVSSHEEFEEATENTKSYRESSEEQVPQEVLEEAKSKSRRKRKRDDEDLEVNYMQRLAEEEAREDAKRDKERQPKRQKATEAAASNAAEINGVDGDSDGKMEDAESDEDEEIEVPKHESLTTTQTSEVEKANRTVFLGNVSAEAVTSKSAKKTLIQYMSSFLESMPKEKTLHKLASIRFRSTAYTNMLPKKASYVTQDLMESTTKSTNAYVVYTTKDAARKALTLNGTTVLGRHLRVDSVAHPAKIEPRKCVFVGNLGFVDDGSAVQAADDEESNKKRKSRKKEPSDIEEGLWREFGKCGTVENVRVVRDSKTRVGKGFAYIQFTDENAVEAALLHDGKKFPPMLPRKLRVMRAKGIKRNMSNKDTWSRPATNGVYNPKISGQQKSAIGRASKLLGRAGAALNSRPDRRARQPSKADELKTPESFVFEGHRATAGSHVGKKQKSSKKKGKPNNRSTRRAVAWKAGEK